MLFIRGYYFLFRAFIFALFKLGDAFRWLSNRHQQKQTIESGGWKKILVSLPHREMKHDIEPALVK